MKKRKKPLKRKPAKNSVKRISRKQFLQARKVFQESELRRRDCAKKACSHRRFDGTLNIKWMRHSNDIILGVCGSCISQFDARKPEDLRLLLLDQKSINSMGFARRHIDDLPREYEYFPDNVQQVQNTPPLSSPPTLWERIKQMLLD